MVNYFFHLAPAEAVARAAVGGADQTLAGGEKKSRRTPATYKHTVHSLLMLFGFASIARRRWTLIYPNDYRA